MKSIMKIKNLMLIVVFAASMNFASNAQAAEKVYMPYFELINVNWDYQYSTARLFKNYLEDHKKYTLVLPPKPDSLFEPMAFDDVRRVAKEKKCKYFIIGDMNRLGETVIFSIGLYRTDNGALVWSDRLKADTPEDMDPILQQVAAAIGSEQKAAESGTIYNVTDYESRRLRQVKANNAFGISIGSAFFVSDQTGDPFSGGGGIFWYYDARDIMFEFDAQTYFLGRNGMGFLAINAYHPFSPGKNTFFAGGGLGVGYTSQEYEISSLDNGYNNMYSNTSGGIMFFFGGGYVLSRTSNVGLRIHLRYFIGGYKMEYPESIIPNGLLLNMELYY